jgi:hypothetical protein
VMDNGEASAVARMKNDVGSLKDGRKKRCSKCEEIRDVQDYWDAKLKRGNGGYGRVCMSCKAPTAHFASNRKSTGGWQSRNAWRDARKNPL